MSHDLCACGQPLHYTDAKLKDIVTTLVQESGEFVIVKVNKSLYLVQRHYLALHGIQAADLPRLVREGIVKEG